MGLGFWKSSPWAVLLLGSAVVPAQDQGADGFVMGEELLVQSACINCHEVSPALEGRLQAATAPDLSKVGARLSPSWMYKFLHNPRGLRPHGNMPNMLAGLSAEERGQAGWELASFLSSLGGPLAQEVHATSQRSIESGRQLFHSVGCVACHRPLEDFLDLELSLEDADEVRRAEGESVDDGSQTDPLAVPGLSEGTLAPRNLDIPGLAPMTSVTPLTEFLLDPLSVRPSGLMPDMGLTRSEALDIAVYLLRGQLAQEPVPSPGLAVDVLKGNFSKLDDLNDVTAESQGWAPKVAIGDLASGDNFGLRFQGSLEIPAAGEWTFHLRSDDGSLLWIDGSLMLSNWGVHGAINKQASFELSEGAHQIEVHFFELGGGVELRLEWEGPGVSKEEVPASALSHLGLGLRPPLAEAAEPELVARGSKRFVSLGCGACHTTGTELDQSPVGAPGVGPPLASLAGSVGGAGCLTGGAARGPRWSFDLEKHGALKEFLDDLEDFESELAPAQRLARSMTRFGCVHCHSRAGRGGVHPWDRDYFQAREGADLGDEGRLPPRLDGVGGKLKLEALQGVMTRGEGVRPYMTTRMPQFGEQNVGWMAEAFAALDPDLPRSQASVGDHVILGVQLMGTEDGLGCIQCHDFAGSPSLGIRAVDLGSMGARIKPGWFEALLRDPQRVNMNTRMAELFVDGKSLAPDVLEGDPMAQIRAVWQALSLGDSMPPPPGLITHDSAFELRPSQGVVTCGVFMRDMSPRTLVVGFPELVHYAFDMQNSRLGRIWQGRFFNARGTWEGRAGSLEMPPGSKVIELPRRTVLAKLDTPDAPWPEALGREAGLEVVGRKQALGEAPIFRYRIGDVGVEETLRPVQRNGRRGFVRSWTLEAESADAGRNLVFRPLPGGELSALARGLWQAKVGGQLLEIHLGQGFAQVPLTGVLGELRWPVVFQPMKDGPERFGATFSLEMFW